MVLDIAIDLGSNSVLTYMKTKGIIAEEPSVVAIDKISHKVLKVGKEANMMLGRTPGNIMAIHPLRDGVISQYEITVKLLSYFIKKSQSSGIFKPRVLICVPSCISEVEERALCDAASAAGAKRVYLIEESYASAIGAGIETTKANGNMVINIGAGTCEIAVISLGSIVACESVKVAGNHFNDAIVKHIRKNHNVLIGEKTAEEIKIKIGSVLPFNEVYTAEFKGRCIIEGLPKIINVDSNEIFNVLSLEAITICDRIVDVIERTPPDLLSDISKNGIIITGGSCKLFGLDKLIERVTGIKTLLAENPVSSAAIGAGRSLDLLNVMPDGVLNISRACLERL